MCADERCEFGSTLAVKTDLPARRDEGPAIGAPPPRARARRRRRARAARAPLVGQAAHLHAGGGRRGAGTAGEKVLAGRAWAQAVRARRVHLAREGGRVPRGALPAGRAREVPAREVLPRLGRPPRPDAAAAARRRVALRRARAVDVGAAAAVLPARADHGDRGGRAHRRRHAGERLGEPRVRVCGGSALPLAARPRRARRRQPGRGRPAPRARRRPHRRGVQAVEHAPQDHLDQARARRLEECALRHARRRRRGDQGGDAAAPPRQGRVAPRPRGRRAPHPRPPNTARWDRAARPPPPARAAAARRRRRGRGGASARASRARCPRCPTATARARISSTS